MDDCPFKYEKSVVNFGSNILYFLSVGVVGGGWGVMGWLGVGGRGEGGGNPTNSRTMFG